MIHSNFFFVAAHMGVVATLAILGNLFLVFVIWRGNGVAKQKISPVQLLLLHTCVADILFALLSLGTEILILNNHPYFYAPEYICKLVRYMQMLPMYASPFLLVALSVDRYQAICRPLVHYRSDRYRRPNCLAFSAWLLAILLSIPQIFVWHKPKLIAMQQQGPQIMTILSEEGFLNVTDVGLQTTPVEDECKTIYGQDSSLFKSLYVIWFNSLAWLLPSVISAVFYCRVCTTVWRSKCSLNGINKTPSSVARNTRKTANSGSRISFLTRDYVNGLRKRSLGFRNQVSEFDRKRLQTVRLTLTIIACNFFLWAPFCLINLVQAFTPQRSLGSFGTQIITVGQLLGNLNSCVNPWIYILFNRKMVGRALTSVFPKKSNSKFVSVHSTSRQTSAVLKMNASNPADSSMPADSSE